VGWGLTGRLGVDDELRPPKVVPCQLQGWLGKRGAEAMNAACQNNPKQKRMRKDSLTT
jgi:hypothetical protein